MPLTRLHTWIAGEVLTASDLNAEFNNIIDNLQVAVTGTMGDGTVTSPGLQFFSDGDTGLYKVGANALGVAAGGINVFVASEFLQASAFLFPVKTATEAVRTAMPGRTYWQSTEQSLHVHTGTFIAKVPALVGTQAGDFVAATNPTGVSGATAYARGKFSTGLSISSGGEVTVATASLLWPAPTVRALTSGSAATYTTPANVRYIDIEVVGGGGGGAGGNGGSNGGNGAATTFSGGTLSGGAGLGGGANVGGAGGAASGGNILNTTGAAGDGAATSGATSAGGSGGSSPFGGRGAQDGAGSNGGAAVANTGSGGAGGGTNANNNPGGGGGAGGYLRHRIANPAATYTYTIGAGGTAGTAGASAGAGGAGGSGLIIVTEYYI